MNIETGKTDLSGSKTLKVSIPKKLHLHLHSRKLLTGTTISETVQNALNAYLEDGEETADPEQVA